MTLILQEEPMGLGLSVADMIWRKEIIKIWTKILLVLIFSKIE